MKITLFNIELNKIENVPDTVVMDKLYEFTHRPIIESDNIGELKNDDGDSTGKLTEKLTEKLIKKLIKKTKKKISELEYKMPLYDTYSNNIYLIDKYDIYDRVTNKYYRFPDKKIIDNLKYEFIIPNDVLRDRSIKKIELMKKFMGYFDTKLLYKTFMIMFYKYSTYVGKEITFCKNPSFLPQLNHIKPYFTRNEIITIALNMQLITIDDCKLNKLDNINNMNNMNNINNMEAEKLCNDIMKYEISYNMLLNHKKHMIGNDALSMIQFYTLQGSSMFNLYLRNLVSYKSKNKYLESLIDPMWKLILSSPPFDNDYIFYRFVSNDDYLQNIDIGDFFIEKGFMSTTRNPFYKSSSYQFGFILIKIKVPKNITGIALCLETISHFPEEQEIVFPPKSKFKLINKNTNCTYYHTDEDFTSKVTKKYEFEWISNDKITWERTTLPQQNPMNVDFIKLEKNTNIPLNERIIFFEKNYVNEMGQFTVSIGNNVFTVIREFYDSSGAYKKFYAVETKNGFGFYVIHNNNTLFYIEISDCLHINYYVKNSSKDDNNTNSIITDDQLIYFYSTIAYYFGSTNVYIYANYMGCDSTSIFGGSYCLDFYQYFVTNKKKYSSENILSTELRPCFSYYDLDILKRTSCNVVLEKNDGEIYQIFEKGYKDTKGNDTISEFYVWLKNTKCYLIATLTNKIDALLGENNPFKKDAYILDPSTYLYNRSYIKTYPSQMKININLRRDNLYS